MSARIELPSGLVTFLFTDIEGSTRLVHTLGDDYRSILHEHRAILRCALSAAGGVELFTEGDSLFVVFSEAAAALSACAQAQRDLAAYPWPSEQSRPLVRMGLHTGVAIPIGGEYTSAEVHLAARVAAAAHGGQVLCSATTAKTARAAGGLGEEDVWLLDLGLHRLRGFDGRQRLLQLVAPGLDRQFPRPRTSEAPPHNLPVQPSRFIGRGAERVELRQLITTERMVTVVGPGGAGKTRLAVEIAGDLVDRYADGVWFVDLSSVADGRLVDLAVAEVLGVRPEPGRHVLETIADHVASRNMLLVLDTCDALPSQARTLARRVLSAGPETTILATSREPIRPAGEMVWRIPPLRLTAPPGGGYSDAVALLVDRAAAARGGRRTTASEIVDFGRIAVALGGLPLALELAAARLRVLSTGQLATRLDDVLGTLDAGAEAVDLDSDASARHRTMQATVTWSYRTLGDCSAWLLRRLSVFAGPVDLSAIEWLHGGDPLDPLATLVDKSLLQAEPGRYGATYRMLDPIRAYAARRLTEAGEEKRARDRHVQWCLMAVRSAQNGPDERRHAALSLYALDPFADELRAALRWTVTAGSAGSGFAVVAALNPWWRERGLAREGRMWLFQLYDRITATGEQVSDLELAGAYHIHALLAEADGEYAEELLFSQRAERAAQRSGDPALIARVRAGRGAALIGMGRHAEAERTCRKVIASAERNGVASEALLAVYALAGLLWRRGDLDRAADLLATARPIEAAHPEERGRRTVDLILGLVAISRGDLVAAHEHLVVALRSRMRYGFHSRACEALSAMAVRCAASGDWSTAARLFGAAQSARAELRCAPGVYGSFWTQHHGVVRTALGDSAFDAAYSEGGALGLDEAVALAFTVEHPDLVVGSTRF